MSDNNNKSIFSKEDSFISSNPTIFKKYKPIRVIGKGTFSSVYLSININTGQKLAIKVEKRENSETDLLESEAFLLYSLRGFGIPEVISFGRTKTYNILIEPLLGISLLDLYSKKNKKILMKDICLIAIQLLDRIEWVHTKNIVYRDVKPENFLFGKIDPEVLYIIDFGLCRKYKYKNGKHINPKNTGKFTGTSRYASIYAMAGNEQSRRDDIESIGYLLIFLMKGKLPWQGVTGNSHKECYQKLYLMKKYMPIEKLCNGLPEGMSDYLKYAKNLRFEEKPDYNYLRSLFKEILKFLVPNISKYMFSWLIKDDIKNKTKPLKKSSPQNNSFRKIEKSLEHKKSTSPMSQQTGLSSNFVKKIKNLNIIKKNNNWTAQKNDIKDYNSNKNFNDLNIVNTLQRSNNNNATINLNNTNTFNKGMSKTLPINYNQMIKNRIVTESDKEKNTLNLRGKIPSFEDRIILNQNNNSSSNKIRDNLIDNILIKRKLLLSDDLDRKKNIIAKKIIIEDKNRGKQSQNSSMKKTNCIPINKEMNYNNSYGNILNVKKNLATINLNQFKTENHIRNNISADNRNNKNFVINNINNSNTINGNINTVYKKQNKDNINIYKKNSDIHIIDKRRLVKRSINNSRKEIAPNHKIIRTIVTSSPNKNNNNINNIITGSLSRETSKVRIINGKKQIIKIPTGDISENINSDKKILTRFPIFSNDKNRKLKNQNSMIYNSKIINNNRNNINNLNISNPTINININNKNPNISPAKTGKISNIKRFSISNSKTNKSKLLCINISDSIKKNDSSVNSSNNSISNDNKKNYNRITSISKYHDYYSNINNDNKVIHRNATNENLLNNNNNNSSVKIDNFSNQTYQYGSASNTVKTNCIIKMKPIINENSSINNKNKQIITPVIKYSNNIDNITKYNTSNKDEINYSLVNSKSSGVVCEDDDSSKNTYNKRKKTSMQFQNISNLDTGAENKNIMMNDISKYSFITKNNSRTFMINNNNNNENNKKKHFTNTKQVGKTSTVGNDDDTYHTDGVNNNKGTRIDSYIVNRKKIGSIPKI